jgi:cob(I)alamin adenosyltransferase
VSGDEASRASEEHRLRMQRRKARIDARVAEATEDRGVVLVLTGSGKGKSSSAFGMLARALGHNMRVGIVQFIKGTFSTGEEAFFRRFPDVRYYVMGEGFTWDTQDLDRDIRAASAAWTQALDMMSDSSLELLVLDELNIALKYGYVPLPSVLAALQGRPRHQHVVITGRAAPQALMDAADTVTEMRVVKHAFSAGIRAQKGIEL